MTSASPSTMPRTTIILGIILIVVGQIIYLASSRGSWTAQIPAILGVVVLCCGFIARRATKVGIHLALVIAVIGIAGTFMNVLKFGALLDGTAERPLAVIASIITFVLLLVYLILGIRSFVVARRWRTSEQA